MYVEDVVQYVEPAKPAVVPAQVVLPTQMVPTQVSYADYHNRSTLLESIPAYSMCSS
jgi:hypothetical protein